MIYKSNKKINKKEKIFDNKRLFSYAIWLLSKRDYSIHEMKTKMKKYQPDDSIIQVVIEKLESLSYLDDHRKAKSIISQYSSKEGVKKIEARLFQKGIPKDIIKEIIEETKSTNKDDDNSVILNLLIKKYKEYDAEEYKKYCTFLASRGFSWNEISKTILLFKEINS